MRVRHSWILLPALLLATACSDKGETSTTPDTTEEWNLTAAVSGGQKTILAGDNLTLTVEEIRDGVRRVVAASELEWRIVSGTAVSVNASGVVTSIQPGTAVVEARRGDETVTFTITVTPRPVTTIQLGQVAAMVRGDTATMALTGSDGHGTTTTISNGTLVSRSPSVIEVISDGRIVATATGSAVLVATSGALRDSVTVQVTLGEPVSLGMQLAAGVAAGDSLLATFAPVDRRNNALPAAVISVSSGNTLVAEPRLATVTGNGSVWIKSKTAGLATIHASSAGAATSVVLNVGAPRLLALHAGVSASFFFWQDSASVTLTGDYSDGSTGIVTGDVTWSVVSGSDRFSTSNGRVRTVGAPYVGSVRRDIGAAATLRATLGLLQSDVNVGSGSQRPTSLQVSAPAAAVTGDIITLTFVYRDSTGTVVPSQRIVGTRGITPAAGAIDQSNNQWQVTLAGTNTFTASYTEGGVAAVNGNVSITVTAPAPPAPEAGYLDLQIIGTMPPAVLTAFNAARDRINQVIPLLSNAQPLALNVGAGGCGSSSPATNMTIPGVRIYAEVTAIDGAGNILGSAGPCYIRNSAGRHPILGQMRFDSADLNNMVANGTIGPVILHEMLHVMGVGTIWSYSAYASGLGGANPRWLGPLAMTEYQIMGGADFAIGVPIENTGGSGTKDSHWRETTFGTELMTGWINGASAPFSRMTMASLADQAYTVSYTTADAFTLLSGLQAAARMAGPGLDLGAGEILEAPMFMVAGNGAVTAIGAARARP